MKAVLFDMDGILIDTEKYLTVYKQKAMREAGYRLDLETAYKFRSCASVFAREQMKGIFGEDFPYDELRRRRQELMSDHIARFGIEKKPYVEETIKELKRRGYQTAVVTATAEDRAVRYLEMVGFKELFDEIISASMVKLGKPRPDVYLYACEKIGRKPEECMAVEDSPNGVNAAYQAGCPCDDGSGSDTCRRRGQKDGRSCRSRPARTSGISEITPENEESRYPVSRISAFMKKKNFIM